MKPDDSNQAEFHSGFDSRDCVDIVFDGPGDSTVRPMRPVLLKLALKQLGKAPPDESPQPPCDPPKQ